MVIAIQFVPPYTHWYNLILLIHTLLALPYTMTARSEVWDHFYSGKEKAGNNQTHKAAWCIYCTGTIANIILNEDEDKVRNGLIIQVRSRDERLTEGMLIYHQIINGVY